MNDGGHLNNEQEKEALQTSPSSMMAESSTRVRGDIIQVLNGVDTLNPDHMFERFRSFLQLITMKGFGVFFCLTVFLTCQLLAAETTTLYFGQCSVTTNLHKIRQAFSDIRQAIQAEDAADDVRLLTTSTFHAIQAEESCCFLRHVLRFYVEIVFKHHTPSSSHVERRTSSLANSFLGIKRDLRQCHAEMKCYCGEESTAEMKKIQSAFEKLDLNAAAVKAIGEIDILIEWMQRSHHN
ncbi:interleukin 19 like [Heptranchias perlo]|uniref:interleukin 19 like n=1 Tax=Heptranchias perlo TaxID=212740 RepID=UPI00355A25B4